MTWQSILKSFNSTLDAIRSPSSIKIHQILALLASSRKEEKPFIRSNEPLFRVFQRSAQRLLLAEYKYQDELPLLVKKSSIPDSGNGVFAQRKFQAGDALTLYPGCIYTHLSMPTLETSVYDTLRETDSSLLLPPSTSAYTAFRYDGVHIDALDLAEYTSLSSACLNHFNGLAKSSALGHIIQHCGGNRIPNSITLPIDFFILEEHLGGIVVPNDVDKTAQETFFVPPYGGRGKKANDTYILPWKYHLKLPYWRAESNKKFSGPLPIMMEKDDVIQRKRACVIPGLIVIAAQTINRGDELFQDYALSTKESPKWYEPVSSETRWRLFNNLQTELQQSF